MHSHFSQLHQSQAFCKINPLWGTPLKTGIHCLVPLGKVFQSCPESCVTAHLRSFHAQNQHLQSHLDLAVLCSAELKQVPSSTATKTAGQQRERCTGNRGSPAMTLQSQGAHGGKEPASHPFLFCKPVSCSGAQQMAPVMGFVFSSPVALLPLHRWWRTGEVTGSPGHFQVSSCPWLLWLNYGKWIWPSSRSQGLRSDIKQFISLKTQVMGLCSTGKHL